MFIGFPSVTGNEMEDTVLQLKDRILKLEGGNYHLNLLFTVAGIRNIKKMNDKTSSKKKADSPVFIAFPLSCLLIHRRVITYRLEQEEHVAFCNKWEMPR